MAATTHSLRKSRDGNIVKNITEIMNNGYKECLQNKHENVCLELTHIYFERDIDEEKVYQPDRELLQQNLEKIETIWCEDDHFYPQMLGILKSSSKSITTLHLPYVNESLDLNMCSCLQALVINCKGDRPAVCLDMSKCQLLELLDIEQQNLSANIDTDHLQYCRVWYCDISQGNIVETLSKRNNRLRNLDLYHCRLPRKTSGHSKSLHLDFTSCSSLEKLSVRWCEICVSINKTNLQKCTLWSIDLSQGNLLKALSSSTELTRLRLYYCRFPEADERHNNKVCIDMSDCLNLSEIHVEDSDVIIQYNGICIGKELKRWQKDD